MLSISCRLSTHKKKYLVSLESRKKSMKPAVRNINRTINSSFAKDGAMSSVTKLSQEKMVIFDVAWALED